MDRAVAHIKIGVETPLSLVARALASEAGEPSSNPTSVQFFELFLPA